MTQELLSCPFCGATEDDDCIRVVAYGEPGLTLYKVVCTCGAANEGGFTEAQIIGAWNRRDQALRDALVRIGTAAEEMPGFALKGFVTRIVAQALSQETDR